MKQHNYEKILNIKTAKSRFTLPPTSLHYNAYEPTNYEALELLLREYEIGEDDHIVDFGSGKGRLNFYLNYYTGANVLGIEMDEQFLEDALVNLDNYKKKHRKHAEKVEFHACLAQEYRIAKEENIFYFFNPFSLDVFRKVIYRILGSVTEYPRKVDVVLFYPHHDYIFFLEEETPFKLIKEIRVDGFYEKDHDERFLIYRWEG